MTAAPLAFAAVAALADRGHHHLYATVLDRPVRNGASLPLLGRIGARAVGTVEEDYDGVGTVTSELHHLALDQRFATLRGSNRGRRLEQRVRRLTAAGMMRELSARAPPNPRCGRRSP
jgi:hypothetical protein